MLKDFESKQVLLSLKNIFKMSDSDTWPRISALEPMGLFKYFIEIQHEALNIILNALSLLHVHHFCNIQTGLTRVCIIKVSKVS